MVWFPKTTHLEWAMWNWLLWQRIVAAITGYRGDYLDPITRSYTAGVLWDRIRENVPGIPGAWANAILRIWQEAHVRLRCRTFQLPRDMHFIPSGFRMWASTPGLSQFYLIMDLQDLTVVSFPDKGINPHQIELKFTWLSYVNIMVADGMVSWVIRSSAVMLLTILSWCWWNFWPQPIRSTEFGHVTSQGYATHDPVSLEKRS